MHTPKPDKQHNFLSLRVKLLAVFTLVFTGVFSALFYTFYEFAVDGAVRRMRKDLQEALMAAASGVDTEELVTLYREGEPNDEGFSDDPRYRNQLDWFEEIHAIDPNIWPYTFVRGNKPDTRRNGEIVATNDEVIFLVDLWSLYNASKSVKFLEPYAASPQMIESLQRGILIHRPETPLYDAWGGWITAYAPLRDEHGRIIPGFGIGADMTAEYLFEVQRDIRRFMIATFFIFYILLFLLVYFASGFLTRPTLKLAQVARKIGEGEYEQDPSKVIALFGIDDEISQLARIFNIMVEKVRQRETKLKQQVSELKIQIDQQRRQREVKEITDNDFFKSLEARAKEFRKRK